MAKQFDVGVFKPKGGGPPVADIRLDAATDVNDIPRIIMGVTGNEDLMRSLGLKGCPACKSGLDFRIRELYDNVIRVEF